MKIDSPNKNKIIVELTDEDMLSLDITYDELDYSNIETRRVIWTILAKARKSLGRDIDPSGKIVIETLPSRTGGCMILFTVSDKTEARKSNLPVRLSRESAVYELDSIDNVIDLYNSIKSSYDFPLSAELYSDKSGKFRIITRLSPDWSDIKCKLSEYGIFCGENDVVCSHTREHWRKENSDFFS